MEIDWNLDPQKISEIPIYQIYFKDLALENHPEIISLRLLILAHKIALSEIPAFYLDSSLSIQPPNDFDARITQNVIIFDIEGLFEQNEMQDLPFWAHVTHWNWIPGEIFTDQIVEAFSRALTLRLYYRHFDLNPLYFSSYILIPGGDSFFEPFLVQPVPVLRQGCLQIRTVLQSGLDCIINPKNIPPPGSFILFPPNEHPLFILSVEPNNIITALTIEKEKIQINTDIEKFVFLTNPSLIMPKFFENDIDNSITSTSISNNNADNNLNDDDSNINHDDNENVPLCQFKNLKLFDYTESELESYFASKFSNDNPYDYDQADVDNQNSELIETNDTQDTDYAFLEDTIPGASQVITEIIPSGHSEERKKILSCIGQNGSFPTKRSYLTCIKANFLSYYRFDFGFSTVNPPSFIKRFGNTSRVQYQRLGIPYIVLNKNGDKHEEQADRALSLWESDRFIPISGHKDAHYVVFVMEGVNMDSVETFLKQFTAVYSSLGFGALTPYPRGDFAMTVPLNDIPQTLMDYFHPPTEFQQYPVISFIVGPPIFSANFKPHSIVNYIRPSALESATLEEVKTLAFVVYSRIRNFAPQPTGMIEPLVQQEIGVVLFGFRYQPPFLLSRSSRVSDMSGSNSSIGGPTRDLALSLDNMGGGGSTGGSSSFNYDNSMELHVAWDPKTCLSVWIDGIGSILHFLPVKHVMSISSFIEKAKDVLHVRTKFTVTILGEGISSALYNECDEGLPPDVEIYSVSPSPSVSAHFEEDFADDVVVFESPEQCFEVPKRLLSSSNSFAQPSSTAASHGHSNGFGFNDFSGFDGLDELGHNQDQQGGVDGPDVVQQEHYVQPSATCYVMSKFQPPYMASIYRRGGNQQLLEYVTKMSHLSWLSVKPGDEKRTISYPPHICALLRKNNCTCLTISRFEFLPSQEKI